MYHSTQALRETWQVKLVWDKRQNPSTAWTVIIRNIIYTIRKNVLTVRVVPESVLTFHSCYGRNCLIFYMLWKRQVFPQHVTQSRQKSLKECDCCEKMTLPSLSFLCQVSCIILWIPLHKRDLGSAVCSVTWCCERAVGPNGGSTLLWSGSKAVVGWQGH